MSALPSPLVSRRTSTPGDAFPATLTITSPLGATTTWRTPRTLSAKRVAQKPSGSCNPEEHPGGRMPAGSRLWALAKPGIRPKSSREIVVVFIGVMVAIPRGFRQVLHRLPDSSKPAIFGAAQIIAKEVL